MDAELKAKWVKALRSGRYKQARGKLSRRDAYCCLGVLCKVKRIPIKGDKIIGRENEGYRPIWELVPESDARDLAGMNDAGKSFSTIADHIETNL